MVPGAKLPGHQGVRHRGQVHGGLAGGAGQQPGGRGVGPGGALGGQGKGQAVQLVKGPAPTLSPSPSSPLLQLLHLNLLLP